MKRKQQILAVLAVTLNLLATNTAWAEEDSTVSYGEIFGHKILSGLANMTTGMAEIPKNIIIINNQSNFAYGFVGGTLKGMLHMGGRMGVGMLDLFTAPIPSEPIVDPIYVWDDFYKETTYGPAFVDPNP
ncbi:MULTISPECIES: exosortase system-associated protein, TIGR04073 family [Methylomonas]|uniref:exosortase system-associated protein, TIGR04073 family n=1 Tax=Methylomonas TaxID=416 RepID=UPI00123277CC|nr:exosortase system-associated protein, TIGR04073 family [Methylomonas rhizoryzae]